MEQQSVPDLLRAKAAHLPDLDDPSFASTFDDLGKNKLVLMGAATHGTHEFYEARAKISQYLIEKYGFNIIAIEADWPDAEIVDRHVRRRTGPKVEQMSAFYRFPQWVWRNREVQAFVEWLREHNKYLSKSEQVGFYGLDLYGLDRSMEAVINTLAHANPEMANVARQRYSKVMPWIRHLDEGPETIGNMVASTEVEVESLLRDLLQKRLDDQSQDENSENFHGSEQNAWLVSDAEQYYKAMLKDPTESWNLRENHMFQTLKRILEHRGEDSKAIVWAHNSHVGSAKAMGDGCMSLGGLVREQIRHGVALLGFGTCRGTVAAARGWGSDMEYIGIPPAIPESLEAIAHQSRLPRFFVDLREGKCDGQLRKELTAKRKERFLGVVYDPDEDPEKQYQEARLSEQFDSYIWFDETTSVRPLEVYQQKTALELVDTYPWGL